MINHGDHTGIETEARGGGLNLISDRRPGSLRGEPFPLENFEYLRVLGCNLVQRFGKTSRKITANFLHFFTGETNKGFWPWILGAESYSV